MPRFLSWCSHDVYIIAADSCGDRHLLPSQAQLAREYASQSPRQDLQKVKDRLLCRVIAQHRDALENGIYADGLEHTRHLLCMDVVPACGAHSLYDSGEL